VPRKNIKKTDDSVIMYSTVLFKDTVVSDFFGIFVNLLIGKQNTWSALLTVHFRSVSSTPIEGMGLLEYQAMPSLLNVAHNGWLCTSTIE
jgi:hypothetical protein